jgi:predicted ATPase/class 3 adenylate cyclase
MCALRQLPAGTITFLFTDIEGSTQVLHELGDSYGEVLVEHRRLLREAFSRHGGVEVDTQGDALFVAFTRASDAANAALDGQRALAGGPVRVRMGAHTGEPVVTAEGYVGMDVHRGARVMSAGHGGQILLSQTTRDLLEGAFPLLDLGEHRLKDLTAPQRLYQLGGGDFPPPRTLSRTNLPIQPTPLVGRERDLEEAGALLRTHRLLTLTGPGGSGKTRLALQLAAEAAERFPDGVFWVPLQALRDPALVDRAIAASVGAADDLVAYVGSKRLLVLLDNFEQVIEAAPSITSLLAGTQGASVLVTSREPLQLEGEQRYAVDPLPIDDAVVLFTERAQLVAPGFQPTSAVEEICRRLDGLPLAVELAAARVALLDADELLARLEQRLPVLTSRSRDAPARQRTLRSTIEWSYGLLEPGEAQLFRRLAVFRGSFALEAAEAVCDADLDTLESLAMKSLVRRWGGGRLGMLDTIREYAVERLDGSHEAEEVRRRHGEYFLAVFQDANLNAGPSWEISKPQRHDVALAEQDNLRGALTWAIERGFVPLALELARAADWFWVMTAVDEGKRWFESLLDRPELAAVDPHIRADALRAYSACAFLCGDFSATERAQQQSLALYDELGDQYGRAVVLHRLGISAMVRGDLELARELVEEARALHARHSDPRTRAFRLGEMTGTLGAIARDAGDAERAHALISESAAAAREAGIVWWEGGMLAELGALALTAGRLDDAEAYAKETLAIADSLRDKPGRVFGVGLLAWVAAARGEVGRAGRLWGAIEDEVALAPLGGWRRHRDACEALMRQLAGPVFEQGRAEGKALTLDEATALALAVAPP